MNRPASIVNFERFFWASFAVGIVGAFFGWDKVTEAVAASPTPFYMTAVVGTLLILGAISIAFWYGIARRASNVVRWIYIVWMGFGSAMTILPLLDPQTPRDVALIFSLGSTALTIASIVCLFRGDAVAWLKGKLLADPSIFE